MEETQENIELFRLARWQVRAAKIAAAMCGGWPFNEGVHTLEYRECLEKLRKAEQALAAFPAEWHARHGALAPKPPPRSTPAPLDSDVRA